MNVVKARFPQWRNWLTWSTPPLLGHESAAMLHGCILTTLELMPNPTLTGVAGFVGDLSA